MKHVVKTMVVITLALLVAAPVLAGDKAKKKDAAKGKRKANAAAPILRKLQDAGLSDEQEAKIKELGASFGPKLAEARKKAALTADQRAAIKQAREDGKKGKEIFASVGLSDDQKAAREELQKIQREFNSAVLALLNPEQKKKAGLGRGARKKGNKPAGDKKKAAPAKKKPAEKAAAEK